MTKKKKAHEKVIKSHLKSGKIKKIIKNKILDDVKRTKHQEF